MSANVCSFLIAKFDESISSSQLLTAKVAVAQNAISAAFAMFLEKNRYVFMI
jgi:hypothetical protein